MEQFKKAKAILIPTNLSSILGKRKLDNAQPDLKQFLGIYNNINLNFFEPQQLLIISDDENERIERDALVYHKIDGIVKYCKELWNVKDCKKIIASYPPLNNLIGFDANIKDIAYEQASLPQPSQQFIEQYIESYNKGEVITDVLVEYGYFEMNSKANYKGNYDFICPNCKHIDEDLWYSKQPTYCTNCSKLKINPDNTITIKPVKDSWDREEMFKLMDDYQDYLFRTNEPVKTFKEWFNQNL